MTLHDLHHGSNFCISCQIGGGGPLYTYQIEQGVVEHGRDALDHDLVGEDGVDALGEQLERADGAVTHDVVEAGLHAEYPQLVVLLLPLLGGQGRPRLALLLRLLLLDL